MIKTSPPSPSSLDPSADELRAEIASTRTIALGELALLSRGRLRSALRAAELAGGTPEAKSSVSAELERHAALRRAAARSQVPEVKPDPMRAIVHGRVVDARDEGIEDVWVVVLDAAGREAAKVETAERGYFRFSFPSERGERPKEAPATNQSAAKPDPKENEKREGVEIRLEVRNACGDCLGGSKPFRITRGGVVYREVEVKRS